MKIVVLYGMIVFVWCDVLKVLCEDSIMEWYCCEFEYLSVVDFYVILCVCNVVLVVEDVYMYFDIDGKDVGVLYVFVSVYDGDMMEVVVYVCILLGDDIDFDVVIDKVLMSESCCDDDMFEWLIGCVFIVVQVVWLDIVVCMYVFVLCQVFYKWFGFCKVYGLYFEQGVLFVGLVWLVDCVVGVLCYLLLWVVLVLCSDDLCVDGCVYIWLFVDIGVN